MSASTSTIVTDYDFGVSAIDAGYVRPLADAIHLIVEGDAAAIVDSGVNTSVPRVLQVLQAKGIERDAVSWLLLTHVHLDHAGGAGALMQALPRARLGVHPRGARHMIDPARLFAATMEVYGAERARELYGEPVPVDARRVVHLAEGDRLEVGGRRLVVLETAGHARHHVCYVDERSGHVFAGDMFGVSYRELDRDGRAFVFPSTTPTQFDPDAYHHSVTRILALRPAAVYLTHYGQVGDVERLGADLLRLVGAHAELGRAAGARRAGDERRAFLVRSLEALVVGEADAQGWALQGASALDLMRADIDLNAAGLDAWIASAAS